MSTVLGIPNPLHAIPVPSSFSAGSAGSQFLGQGGGIVIIETPSPTPGPGGDGDGDVPGPGGPGDGGDGDGEGDGPVDDGSGTGGRDVGDVLDDIFGGLPDILAGPGHDGLPPDFWDPGDSPAAPPEGPTIANIPRPEIPPALPPFWTAPTLPCQEELEAMNRACRRQGQETLRAFTVLHKIQADGCLPQTAYDKLSFEEKLLQAGHCDHARKQHNELGQAVDHRKAMFNKAMNEYLECSGDDGVYHCDVASGVAWFAPRVQE